MGEGGCKVHTPVLIPSALTRARPMAMVERRPKEYMVERVNRKSDGWLGMKSRKSLKMSPYVLGCAEIRGQDDKEALCG